MSRIQGPVWTVNTDFGPIRYPVLAERVVVGDRMVPSPIEVEFPGADGQPSLRMVVEVIDGVPRCTELTFRRTEGGREIRQRDLRAIEIDSWVEVFVAKCSGEIAEGPDASGYVHAVHRVGEASVRHGVKTIRDVRKGSRRPMTDARKRRVAEIYDAHESGGIEAVEAAFAVSRSTAVRYIKAARDAGMIEKRKL